MFYQWPILFEGLSKTTPPQSLVKRLWCVHDVRDVWLCAYSCGAISQSALSWSYFSLLVRLVTWHFTTQVIAHASSVLDAIVFAHFKSCTPANKQPLKLTRILTDSFLQVLQTWLFWQQSLCLAQKLHTSPLSILLKCIILFSLSKSCHLENQNGN